MKLGQAIKTATESSSVVRWFVRKYGLSTAEAAELVALPQTTQVEVEEALESWRSLRGYPLHGSPLVRGKLLSLMRKES